MQRWIRYGIRHIQNEVDKRWLSYWLIDKPFKQIDQNVNHVDQYLYQLYEVVQPVDKDLDEADKAVR